MAIASTPTYKITPSATKAVLPSNYVSLYDFSHAYLPETHDEIARQYGNQSITGLLYLLGAEGTMAADQFIWTEDGRLHTVYTDAAWVSSTGIMTKAGHNFRKNETVHISNATTKMRGIITAVTANSFTVAAYKASVAVATGTVTVFVDGTEYRKGTFGMEGSVNKDFTVLKNNPIILKDNYEESGSDMTNIGWIKTSSGGYLWYLESEFDTRRRWEDRLEMALISGEKSETASGAITAGYIGTEGLFKAIETRGNLFDGEITGVAEWDTVVKRFDAQGKIADYTAYVDRDQSLQIDNDLGALNAGYSGGISYGMFNNSQEMSVDLGFTGFRRGTYSFHKTDYKLFNDPTLIGAVADAAGKPKAILVPVGTKEVYEGAYNGMGHATKNKVPYLHVKYKSAGGEDRKYKTWVTGSVGGVFTNDKDTMSVNHLSERMLATIGANNFLEVIGE